MHSDLVGNRDLVVLDEHHALTDLEPIAVMDEDAAAEVGHSLPLLGMLHLEGSDHTTVGEHQDIGALVVGVDAIESAPGPFEELIVQLVARGPLVETQVPGPLLLDLGSGQPFPFAGIAFHEIGIDHDRSDADLGTDDLRRLEGTDQGRGHDDVDRPDPLRGVEGLLTSEVGECGIGFALPAPDGVPFGLAVADEEEAGHVVTVPDPRDRGEAMNAYPSPVASLRLFASAREAAGTGRDTVPGSTVGEVLAEAERRYGSAFGEIVASSRVWCNGEPASDDVAVTDADEVAVLPPVSGGFR